MAGKTGGLPPCTPVYRSDRSSRPRLWWLVRPVAVSNVALPFQAGHSSGFAIFVLVFHNCVRSNGLTRRGYRVSGLIWSLLSGDQFPLQRECSNYSACQNLRRLVYNVSAMLWIPVSLATLFKCAWNSPDVAIFNFIKSMLSSEQVSRQEVVIPFPPQSSRG